MSAQLQGRVAALDLGEVRTGVAVSDPTRTIARPVAVVPSQELTQTLRRLVAEEGVSKILVGVPKTMGGEVGFQARKVLATLEALRSEFPGVSFVEWDERLTTRMAVGGMRSGSPKRTGRVDHLAAARMLQEYLDAGGASEAPR